MSLDVFRALRVKFAISFFFFIYYLKKNFAGKVREKLKWADGKAVKAEIDMQVMYVPEANKLQYCILWYYLDYSI